MDKYAYLMVDFQTPDYIKDIQKSIQDYELYKPNDPDSPFTYGLETETHVTLAACLDNDIDIEGLKQHLLPLGDYKTMLSDISVFSNDNYDVLKCGVSCQALHTTNAEIKSNYTLHTEFTTYHPHITIAYMNKGYADKYKKSIITKQVFLTPLCFSFGYFDGDEYKKITWM